MVLSWFKNRKANDTARNLYVVIVERMRQPVFYRDLGVPDTLEGRYDLLLVHAFLIFHRLKKDEGDGKDLSQRLFDLMMGDMDQNLRTLGIGDQGVLHRIKAMTEAYHGRVVAYEQALSDDAEKGALESALDRNLYAGTQVDPGLPARMATYMRDQVDALASQPAEAFAKGKASFGDLPTVDA